MRVRCGLDTPDEHLSEVAERNPRKGVAWKEGKMAQVWAEKDAEGVLRMYTDSPLYNNPFYFTITTSEYVGDYFTRCCNCGLPLTGIAVWLEYIVCNNSAYNERFRICNEGCGIDIMQRGYCAAGTHPWTFATPETCEELFPELKRVRDLVRQANPGVSFV